MGGILVRKGKGKGEEEGKEEEGKGKEEEGKGVYNHQQALWSRHQRVPYDLSFPIRAFPCKHCLVCSV